MLNAYTIVFAALLIPAGKLADRLGHRRVFLAESTAFTAASMACGLAPTAEILIVFRIVQAAGAAALIPSSLALVMHAFAHEQLPRAVAIWGAAGAAAGALGPTLGAAIVESLGWRWAFFINLPVGVYTVVSGTRSLHESSDPQTRVPSFVGVALVAGAAALLSYGLFGSDEAGWIGSRTLWLLGGGLATLLLFVAHQRRTEAPALDLDLFRASNFAWGSVAMLVFGTAFSALFSDRSCSSPRCGSGRSSRRASGGMSNAGQTCIGVERVYVHQRVYDAFLSEVTTRVRDLRSGAGEKIGPMTMPTQLDVIRRHIADALARGGRALVGELDAVGERYVQPTVLLDVPEDSSAVVEETFGPTLTIAKVPDMDEAVRRTNASSYVLGATVFSRAHGTELARRIRSGMVAVNSIISFAAIPSLPYGGVKQSGFGRIHGPDGLREFAAAKATARQRFAAPLHLTTFARTAAADKAILTLTTLRHGGAGTLPPRRSQRR